MEDNSDDSLTTTFYEPETTTKTTESKSFDYVKYNDELDLKDYILPEEKDPKMDDEFYQWYFGKYDYRGFFDDYLFEKFCYNKNLSNSQNGNNKWQYDHAIEQLKFLDSCYNFDLFLGNWFDDEDAPLSCIHHYLIFHIPDLLRELKAFRDSGFQLTNKWSDMYTETMKWCIYQPIIEAQPEELRKDFFYHLDMKYYIYDPHPFNYPIRLYLDQHFDEILHMYYADGMLLWNDYTKNIFMYRMKPYIRHRIYQFETLLNKWMQFKAKERYELYVSSVYSDIQRAYEDQIEFKTGKTFKYQPVMSKLDYKRKFFFRKQVPQSRIDHEYYNYTYQEEIKQLQDYVTQNNITPPKVRVLKTYEEWLPKEYYEDEPWIKD